MGKKQIILISSFVLTITVCVPFGWLFFLHVQQWSFINTEREKIGLIKQEIAQYQQLGFAEESELIVLLRQRLHQKKMKKRARKYQWSVADSSSAHGDTHVQLERLFGLNRTMLMSYMKDVQEYKKLGMPNSHTIIRFSYDKIVRLTIALSELERQLHDGSEQGEFTKRVQRMQDITNQSIVQYKDALQQCGDDTKKSTFLRMQLTARMKELDMLDAVKS